MTTRPKPDPCPCCADECPCDSAAVGNCGCPTDLASGVAEVRAGYLGTAFGGVQLTWYNQWRSGGSSATLNEGVGNNWATNELAYMTQQESGEYAFVWTPGRGGKSVWFNQKGTDYVPDYGARQTLTKDGNTWRVTDPSGTVWEFDAITELISKQITPGGQVTEYQQDQGRIVESRRTVGDDVESRELTYDGNGRVSQITLWQGTASTPHATALRRLLLAYYESAGQNGNIGDLKTITEQVPDGLGWADAGTRYFRYYTASSQTSFIGGLKYSVGPTGYASLGSNPDGADESEMLAASESYFEYNPSTRRVTKSKTHGGTQEYSILSTESANPEDYNNWRWRAILTTPDGALKRVYSNHAGQDLLIDLEKGNDYWITYLRYNGDGRLIERASPSAIDMSGSGKPYNDGVPNLDVQLEEDEGLIRVTTYYDMEDPGAGGAPGYPNEQKVQRGVGDGVNPPLLITVSKTEYETKSVGAGATAATIYPVSKQTVYRNESGGGSGPIDTSFTYTWHGSTAQPATFTTTLPNVGGTQNGGTWLSGNTRVQHFDIQGRLTKSVDARGTETEYEYDDASGAIKKMTQDPTPGLNLVTDYESDTEGRITRVTGAAHNVNGQSVRTVQWTVYLDEEHEVRAASGFLDGSTYTLVNPVRITRSDASGRVVDEIEATRGSGVEDTGELTAADSFPQTSWTQWTHHEYQAAGKLTATRVYHLIPTSGDGNSGTNYDETTFAYDDAGRQNFVKTPAGTITRTVYNVRSLVVSTWVGTDDTGATPSNPAGSGSNNMKPVAVNQYDDGLDGGDGLVTKVTSPVDDNLSNDRAVEFQYDWRDRRTTTITTDGTNVFHAVSTYDNLGRVDESTDFRSANPPVLIAKSETEYDNRGQVFRTTRYAVNDEGDDPTIALVDNTWHDENGNVLKSLPAGSELFAKNIYDAIGRNTASYQGYYDGTGTDSPLNLTDNVIFEQSLTAFDEASNVTQSATLARYHDGTGTGALTAGTNARPNYTAYYVDGIGRNVAVAQYGNQRNDNTGFSRSATIPTPSDEILVSKTSYHPSGNLKDQTDAAGQVTRTTYDAAGRTKSTVRNHGGSPTEEVQQTYTPDGQVAKLIAVNATTGNQETEYTYGVTLSGSEIASKDLLQQVEYPDNGVVTYAYNRQGQRTKMTDQNGTVHDYAYDDLGRQTADKATAGTGVAADVKRIAWSYDNRKRLHHVTSYDAATNGNVTSDVEYLYNDFSQVTTEYQQHGSSTSGASPKVVYEYAPGTDNTIRRTKCIYPDTRVVNYDYGSGADDKLSRVQKLKIGTTEIVEYEYLGLNQVVVQKYVEPSNDVVYTLDHGTANAYAGLDEFGRIIDLLWET